MPQATATIGREKRLATLAKNLYVVEGPDPAEAQSRAEAALLRANPTLADPAGFENGAVVRVPTDIGLAVSSRVDASATGLQGGLQDLAQRLQLAAALARDGYAASNKAAEETIAQLSDRTFRATLLKEHPNAEALVAEAAKAQSERQADNKLRQERFDSAVADAIAQTEKLQKLAGNQ